MYKVVDRAMGFVELMDGEGLIAYTSHFYDEVEQNFDEMEEKPKTVNECKEYLETFDIWVITQH